MSFLSGTTALVRNTFFPAAFLAIGSLPKFAETLSCSMADLTLSSFTSAPLTMASFARNHTVAAWQGASLDNAQWLGSSLVNSALEHGSSFVNGTIEVGTSVVESIYEQTPKGSIATLATTLSKHSFEIGAVATFGASATLLEALFKRTPFLKKHPYLRLATTVTVASAATIAGAYTLNPKVDTQMLLNMGIKVVGVGVVAKVLTSTTEVAFTGLRGFSNWASWAFSGFCTGISSTAHLLNYGSLPRTLKEEVEREKEAARKQRKEKNKDQDSDVRLQERLAASQKEGAPVQQGPTDFDAAVEIVEQGGFIVASPLRRQPTGLGDFLSKEGSGSGVRRRNVGKELDKEASDNTEEVHDDDDGEVVVHDVDGQKKKDD